MPKKGIPPIKGTPGRAIGKPKPGPGRALSPKPKPYPTSPIKKTRP